VLCVEFNACLSLEQTPNEGVQSSTSRFDWQKHNNQEISDPNVICIGRVLPSSSTVNLSRRSWKITNQHLPSKWFSRTGNQANPNRRRIGPLIIRDLRERLEEWEQDNADHLNTMHSLLCRIRQELSRLDNGIYVITLDADSQGDCLKIHGMHRGNEMAFNNIIRAQSLHTRVEELRSIT
jgi:hypothetical protein